MKEDVAWLLEDTRDGGWEPIRDDGHVQVRVFFQLKWLLACWTGRTTPLYVGPRRKAYMVPGVGRVWCVPCVDAIRRRRRVSLRGTLCSVRGIALCVPLYVHTEYFQYHARVDFVGGLETPQLGRHRKPNLRLVNVHARSFIWRYVHLSKFTSSWADVDTSW